MMRWTIARWGGKWRIRDTGDWASVPLLLLIVAVASFLTEPVINGYSRWQEHQADIYGLEVMHGVVPDSKSVASHSFQLLGELGVVE